MASIQPILETANNQFPPSQNECEKAVESIRGCVDVIRCVLEADIGNHEDMLETIADQLDGHYDTLRRFLDAGMKGVAGAA